MMMNAQQHASEEQNAKIRAAQLQAAFDFDISQNEQDFFKDDDFVRKMEMPRRQNQSAYSEDSIGGAKQQIRQLTDV